MGFRCSRCDEVHEGLPDLAFDHPDLVLSIPRDERAARVKGNDKARVVDDEAFFVRGVIEIPLTHEDGERFGIGAWVSLKDENFMAYLQAEDRRSIGPYFGWLQNDFTVDGVSSLNLKTMVHPREGLVPFIELEPTDHPLAVAQREGITVARAWEIIHEKLPRLPKA